MSWYCYGDGHHSTAENCTMGYSTSEYVCSYVDGETGGGGSEFGDVVTSPHGGGGSGTQTFPDTPCGRMQKKSNETAFKQKFKDLYKPTNYSKPFETGYYEKADGSLNFITGTKEKPTLKFPPSTTSFIHIHMNNTESIDEDNNVTINYSVKMLSPADVSALISSTEIHCKTDCHLMNLMD